MGTHVQPDGVRNMPQKAAKNHCSDLEHLVNERGLKHLPDVPAHGRPQPRQNCTCGTSTLELLEIVGAAHKSVDHLWQHCLEHPAPVVAQRRARQQPFLSTAPCA